MPRVSRLRTEIVELMPDSLNDGIIYVSPTNRVALHNCCCGCGEEVSTPLGATEYKIWINEGRVSLWPSIGNHDFPCRAHYIIDDGGVIWAGEMSREAIDAGRRHDQFLKRGAKGRWFTVIIAWVRETLSKVGR